MWKPLIIEIKTLLDNNPHLGGDLNVYQSQSNILLALPDGVSSVESTGIAIKGRAGESLAEGDLCYLSSNKLWYKSNCFLPYTLPSTGAASEAAAVGDEIYFILDGILQYSSPFTINLPLNGTSAYVNNPLFEGITNDVSVITTSNVCMVGQFLDSSTVLYSPDYTVLEIV